MVRYTLCPAIQRVEGMACVRCGHDPLVMWLMQSLVHQRMVKPPMYPVYEEIREQDEERNLQNIVEGKRGVCRCVIQLSVTAYLCREERHREDGHDRHGNHGLPYLKPHLVLEVFRVGESGVVEDQEIGERGKDEINDEAEEPQEWSDMGRRQLDKTQPYQVIRYRLSVCRHMLSRARALMYAYCEGSSWMNLLAKLWAVGISRMLEKVEVAACFTQLLAD